MREQGYISIFFLLIFLPLVSSMVLLIAISEYHYFRADLDFAIELGCQAILSHYQREPYRLYGILALDNTQFDTNYLTEILTNNLNSKHFSSVTCHLELKDNINSYQALAAQILDYQFENSIYHLGQGTLQIISEWSRHDESVRGEIIADLSKGYQELLMRSQEFSERLLLLRGKSLDEYQVFINQLYIDEEDIMALMNILADLKDEEEQLQVRAEIAQIAKRVRDKNQDLQQKYSKDLIQIDSLFSEAEGILRDYEVLKAKKSEAQQLSELTCVMENIPDLAYIENLQDIQEDLRYNRNLMQAVKLDLQSLVFTYIRDSSQHSCSYSDLSNTSFSLKILEGSVMPHIGVDVASWRCINEDILLEKESVQLKEFFSRLKKLFSLHVPSIPEISIAEEAKSQLFSNSMISNLDIAGADDSFVNRAILADYIAEHFQCYGYGGLEGRRFFQDWEMEYLVIGKYSAKENFDSARMRMLALRTALNCEYISRNQELLSLINELSFLGTGGNPVWQPIIRLLMIGAVAGAEATLDCNDLLQGKSIPLLKDDESWHLSAAKIQQLWKEDISMPNNEAVGYWTYKAYLAAFLMMEDYEVLLGRVGNLIQLNLSEKSEELDRLDLYSGGIEVEINGVYRFGESAMSWSIPYVRKKQFVY